MTNIIKKGENVRNPNLNLYFFFPFFFFFFYVSSNLSMFDLLHIDWAASVFADWRCAALFPCIWYSGESSIMFACLLVRVSDMFCHGGMSADSQSIDIHGAQTAGKVGVLMMVAASLLFLDVRDWILWAVFGF